MDGKVIWLCLQLIADVCRVASYQGRSSPCKGARTTKLTRGDRIHGDDNRVTKPRDDTLTVSHLEGREVRT